MRALLAALVAVAVALSGCGGAGSARLAGSAATADRAPRFTHAVVIVLENRSPGEVLGTPVFRRLARDGALLVDYSGVAHPSLPNYLALVSGSTHGIASDCTDCTVSARSLADTLEAAGLTWRTYAEGLPAPGFTGASAGRYAKKHDPFLYFDGVRRSVRRRARIVPLSRFGADLAAGRLPTFSLVVPDLCHDMHDCSTSTGTAWLESFLRPLLRSPQLHRGLVAVVFDESDLGESNRVPAVLLGGAVRPGAVSTARLDHYSLLRTLEDAWGLPRLGRSAQAAPIVGVWRRSG